MAKDTKVKMGLGQLGNPTPKWMSNVSNLIIFLATAWGLFAPSITELTETQRGDVTRWVLIISGLIKLATKFFGNNATNPLVKE